MYAFPGHAKQPGREIAQADGASGRVILADPRVQRRDGAAIVPFELPKAFAKRRPIVFGIAQYRGRSCFLRRPQPVRRESSRGQDSVAAGRIFNPFGLDQASNELNL